MAKPKVRPKMDGGMPRAEAAGGLTAHKGASKSALDVAGWIASRGSADADLLPERDTLVYRQRDIHRNNGVAHGGIQTIVDNVVGTGLRLSARPDYLALGKTKEWAVEWAAKTQSKFHGWWWSTECHAGDTLTGDQLTAQVCASQLNNGESLTLPLWLPRRFGARYGTRLQTVESDRLSNPNGSPETPRLHGGQEFDDYGAPIAAHVRRAHPGTAFLSSDPLDFTWERIPRRMASGRLRYILVFDSERPDQSRGKPLLSAVLPQFKTVDRYTQAELQAALANAVIAGIITTNMTNEDIVELFKSDPTSYLEKRREHAVNIKPGSIIPLFPGDQFEAFLPQRPAAAFGAFVENIYRIIAVGLDMPYELLLKDFSKTSYSSARASMLEAWRSFNRRRDWLSTMWADPVYALWLEEAVNIGEIEAPGFYENRAAYQRCKWIGPGKGWVDPVKEAQAAVIRVDGYLSTLEDECAQQGLNWEEVLEQQARERDKREELGLPDHGAIRAAGFQGQTAANSGAPNDGAGPAADAPPTAVEPASAPKAPSSGNGAATYQ